MKDPSTFHPNAPEPSFSDPQYKPDFGPGLNDLQLRDRLHDRNIFLFTRDESGQPGTITFVAHAPERLVHYFVHLLPREARFSRRFDVRGFDDDTVRLAVAWMKAGGRQPLRSLTRDYPPEVLPRLARQVLDFSDRLLIVALAWQAGELLDEISRRKGLPDRGIRNEIAKGLEARFRRNKAEYYRIAKEGERSAMEETAAEWGYWTCLSGCLGVFVCFGG